MPSTSIVVDLGFGDAGKGTIVDALARRCSSPPLVVRYNGGAQAGHNVHTSDGRHHTFSQFGSATFVPGAFTLLSEHMIVHPTGLMRENDRLVEGGVKDALQRLLVHERALVITPYHQAANRLRERARGDARHGTCGIGVGETVGDSLDHPELALRVMHLRDRTALRRRMMAIRDYKRSQIAPLLAGLDSADPDVALMEEVRRVDEIVDAYADVGDQLHVLYAPEAAFQIRETEHVIFEGAQGVLLDEWHGFHPHTTWSTTTTKNAGALIEQSGRSGDVRTIGVVRAYATRHGQGPFPTHDAVLTRLLRETHNLDDGWQGAFRAGWFDVPLARYAKNLCTPPVTELAVTCLDRLASWVPQWSICIGYDVPPESEERFVMELGYAHKPRSRAPGDLAYQEQLGRDLLQCRPVMRQLGSPVTVAEYVDAIQTSLDLPISVMSFGPTAEDKRWTPEWLLPVSGSTE